MSHNSRSLAGAALAIALVASGPAGAVPEFVREVDEIPLYDGLGPVPNAWLGGWEKPRPQLLDIDGDEDLDLFVAEDDGKLRFYRNAGDALSPLFVFETDDYAGVHELYFTRFHDLDADGDFDLLVEAPPFVTDVGGQQLERTGAFLYTNTGTRVAPVWENLSPHADGYLVDDLGDPIPIVLTAPDFVDLEGDGDLDLLFGDGGASGHILLYRNVGSPDSPVFHFESDFYGGVEIIFGFCGGERPAGSLGGPRPGLRHGFMIFTFFDYDLDDDPDLFVGDQFNSNIYRLNNTGGSPDPGFLCQTDSFFPDSLGGPGEFAAQYLLPAFGDLDGDGDPDALLGSGASSTHGIWFYRNDPPLRMLTSDYLPEYDRGRESAPALVDLDGDGALDLFVGSNTQQEVSYYGNIGSSVAPQFALFQEDWLPLPNSAWSAVEFADLDGDTDLDLFVGMTTGAVRFWRNDAVRFVEMEDDADFGDVFGRTFQLNVDSQAVPRFFDEDGDGDLDVLMGNWDFSQEAKLQLFRNDGTPLAHSFVLASTDYQGLGSFGQNVAPVFGDLDGDGDDDLLVGNLAGSLAYVRNDGVPGAPVFHRAVEVLGDIDVGMSSVPYLADIDGDLDPDLFVGERGGGLNFFRHEGNCDTPAAFALLSPAAGSVVDGDTSVRFDWEASLGGEVTYELRLAPHADSTPSEWRTWSSLTESEISLVPREVGFRFRPGFSWTVVATNGCGETASGEWRSGTLSSFPGQSSPFDGERPALLGVDPSPTRGATSVSYGVPEAGIVRLVIYDLLGRRVARLTESRAEAGVHTETWNGRSESGELVAAGIYLVRLEAGGRFDTRRIVVIR